MQYPDTDFAQLDREVAWGYYTGDRAWDSAIIPKLPLNTESNRRTMEEVRRVFQSVNIIKTVVNRHAKALLGQDFLVEVSKGDARDEDAIALLLEFRRHCRSLPGVKAEPFWDAVTQSLVTGSGYLRVYAPQKLASNQGLDKLFIHSPKLGSVTVVRDDSGFIDSIDYHYVDKNQSMTERQRLDDRGITQFEILANGNLLKTFGIDLGGRYSVYELNLDPLVTASTMRNQDAVNHALTMIPRITEYAGFLRDIVLNGQPPGVWEVDELGRDRFIPNPDPMPTGAGVVNYIQGTPLYDQSGNVSGYTNPQVNTHEPSSINSLSDSYRLFESAIYAAVGQSHVLSSDMMLSGVSRQQQRADFVTMLESDAQLVQELAANIYAVTLIMGGGKQYLESNVQVDIRLTTDKPLPEERAATRDDYKAGLLSRRTAIALSAAVPDAEAELKLIEEEKKANEGSSSNNGGQNGNNQGLPPGNGGGNRLLSGSEPKAQG